MCVGATVAETEVFNLFLRPHQNTKNIKSRAVEKLANQKPCKYSAQSNNKEGAKEAGL